MKGKFLLHLFVNVFVIYTIYMSLSRDSLVMYSDHRTAKMARNRKKREPGR